ncbi:hypothetical protein L7F22_063880 [Adiantum nelumboides]|nr:hypothetical protein [Adiantum nelumboides]
MAFGLTNAPATFQRLINTAFKEYLRDFCEAFLDDLCIYSSWEEHLSCLKKVFEKCRLYCISLNPFKCQFWVKHEVILGHIVSKNGISTDEGKIKVILELPPPHNYKGVQRFMGHVGYYRRFILLFAEIARPLYKLLIEFKWTEKCDQAYEVLKKALASAPILRAPNWNVIFHVHIDASNFAIGCVPTQPGEHKLDYPISFGSRQLNDAEKNYTTTEQEGRISRWLLILLEFDFTVVVRPGKKHLMADHLSRITNGEAPTGVDDDLPDTSLFMVETIPEWSEKIVSFLVNGFPPKELRKDVARRLIKECEPYSLIARTLYKLGKDDILKRCARENEYLYILQEAHMGVAGGHFSGPISPAACNTQSRYIIVATDYVTKWAEAKASRKADAITTAKFLFENIIARFGCPFEIVSDNGTHFINEVIKELPSNFMISHHKSTPYYSQANGQAESTNKTLIFVLTKTVEAHRTDWDLKLTSALWAYRTAYKVAINCTPFRMVYGQEAVMPWDFVIPSLRVASQEVRDGNPLVERLYILERLEEERQLAVYNALIEKDRRKKWFDRHLKDKDIKVGDKVLMYGVRNEKKKLKYAGKGPY